MEKPQDLWRMELRATRETVEDFEDALAPFCDSVSRFVDDSDTEWRIGGLSAAEPNANAVAASLAARAKTHGMDAPRVEISRVPQRDWLLENLREFPPLAAGRFFIFGSHFDGHLPPGVIPLNVDAGAAFGSGEHATTEGCLLALEGLANRRFTRPLDVGCGSGILAMAMARLWHVPVLASDIDPRSVQVARENARLNGLAGLVRAHGGPGYRSPVISRGAPYDLIASNILANPLCRMARELARNIAPGGVAVLSGFLERDANRVLSAHRRLGLHLIRRITIRGWQTLVLSR
jgi:ribosomal protein L11 methyltransferase